jgi:hypothetical protein
MNRIKVGAFFSHRYFEELGIDAILALKEFSSLGLKWIRLSCYWDEIEKEKDRYDFHKIETILKSCQSLGLNVVLTLGMKAPRYPEYYLPP